MATLLQYNPNVAAGDRNHTLPGIERFSQFFKIYNPNVVFLDRTGTIKIPIRTKSLFPIPLLRPIDKSFEQICNERARELLARADSLGVKINLFYSGGIDSTLMLISFLKNATPAQRKKLVVLLSEESIAENPNFYRDHIDGKLAVESSMMFPYLLGGSDILVGAEHNDQLFGSDVVARFITKFGPPAIHKKRSREKMFSFFHDQLDDASTTNFYLDLFERLMAASPILIVSNFDYLWWINFSLKWQSVFMRILTFAAARSVPSITLEYINTRYAHFYGTDDFQLWSLNNRDKKIKDEWRTYKWVCKDIIYDYTRDADYRDNKIKRGSLYYLLLQQTAFNFIDDSMHFRRELDPGEYYEPDNDFV